MIWTRTQCPPPFELERKKINVFSNSINISLIKEYSDSKSKIYLVKTIDKEHINWVINLLVDVTQRKC